MRRIALFFALLLLTTTAAGSAGQAQAPARAEGTVAAETTAILVDVVVRDRRGQPVTDLKVDDFEIFEDGVRQEIGSVTLYSRGEAATEEPAAARAARPRTTVAATGDRPAVQPPPSPVIALVFDRLNPEARVLAHRAATGYLEQQAQMDALIGVFGIDLSLVTYQEYTRDAVQVRAALQKVVNRSTSLFESTAARARELGEQSQSGSGTMSTLEGGGLAAAGAAGNAGGTAPAAQFAEMQRRTLETFEALERDQQGHATSNGLLAVVNAMRALPGRKSVVFFSEGVAIPPNVAAQFRSVIDTANRANVSIYAMDAAGLRTESTSKEARDNIMAAASRSLGRNPTADVKGAPMTAALERNEDLIRHDPHSGLGQLSHETGGMLIRNTNDLTGGFRRVDEDMRNYYMLTYVPTNDRFDGKFRTISVNVRRGVVEVASRRGYYAVRAPGNTPVMAFEAPALALLDTTPVPNAFPVRAASITFPESDRPGLAPVVVAVPASVITFTSGEDPGTYKADFTVLVRFRDQDDDVVRKLSQHYALSGPMDRLEAVKQGNVLFYREPELESGVYTMETVVYDAIADKGSVRFSTVELPAVGADALRASELVLISSVERVSAADTPAGNPFVVGDMLLYPNLGEPVRKQDTSELGFFLTVYPGARQAETKATLELVQNGRLVARSPLPLADRDSSGRVQQVSRLPIGELSPGNYDLRVVISQGNQRLVRSTTVRIIG